jgi:hypothetical protein
MKIYLQRLINPISPERNLLQGTLEEFTEFHKAFGIPSTEKVNISTNCLN